MPDSAIEERRQILELAREFADSELRPNAPRWDREQALDRAVLEQLAELGFFGMLVPETFGGLDFDMLTYLGVLQALARGEAVVALLLSIHSAFGVTLLLRHGTDAQKQRWLGALASGDTHACFALTEPDAGSDAGAVQTRARREGRDWVLSGRKTWVTGGRTAGLALVLARTDGAGREPSRSPHLGMFLVPTQSVGYRVAGREQTMGLRAAEIVTVELDELRLPEEALLGEAERGFAMAKEGLDVGRLGIAAQAVGIARTALEHAVAYAGEREQFGSALREFEGMQFKLADMATRVEAASSLVDAASSPLTSSRSAMAKLFASETAMYVTTQAVQVFGGYGYMRDYPVEKLMRDAKATEIYEGTSEIQRLIIARQLYRGGAGATGESDGAL
jgi:alkylation response protein AidB-like acyl-CoA dehydrogenase